MSENIRFKDLIAEGLAGEKSNVQFYLDAERYRRADGFKKDGFKDWTDCLAKLIKKIRRSRSGVMAKMAQVRLLLDTKRLTFAQLEQMPSSNATLLCRVYRVKGLSAAWIKRALTWDVEKFKAAVLKAVKPNEEPKRLFTARLDQSMYVAFTSLIGRIQTLGKINTKEGALEFMVADYASKEDAEILHTASLPAVQALVNAPSNTSGKKATSRRKSKDGSRSTTKSRSKSSRSESGKTRLVTEISSLQSQAKESSSSSAAPAPIMQDAS